MKLSWTVVTLYEDERCRQEAVKYCDSLIARFWSTADLAVHGVSASELEDHATFRNSSTQAAEARYVVFALQPTGEISPTLRGWINSWLSLRGEREGAIVALNDPGNQLTSSVCQKFLHLRNIAHRAEMDYLTDLPVTISDTVPDSLDSYSQRAEQVTSVLDQILRKPIPPPRLVS